jgi:hypothetical protein
MGKTLHNDVHTNTVMVTFLSAVKVVVIALMISFIPGFKPDPVLQEAIGTIFMTGMCWWIRGDFGLQNKIEYVAADTKKTEEKEHAAS